MAAGVLLQGDIWADELPDLVPIVAQAPGEVAGPAQPTVTLVWGVTNQGADLAWWFWDARVCFSTNSYLEYWDPILENRHGSGPLRAGDCQWWTNVVQMPILQSGTGCFLFVVNFQRLVPESNELNDVLSIPVRFNILPPDLTPVAVQVPQVITGPPLPSVPLVWGVTNQGPGPALSVQGSWENQIEFSTDPVSGREDTSLFFGDQPGPLAAGGFYLQTNTVWLPVTRSGTYYLRFKTDKYERVSESNEANNTLAVPVTVQVLPPDLAPITFQAPSIVTGTPNPSITVVWGVTNQGVGPACGRSGWMDAVFLSSDKVLDNRDMRLDILSEYGPVEPGGSYWRTNTLETWGVLQDSTYYLLFVSDINNWLCESDTNNNVVAVPISFRIQPPDLAPIALQAPAEVTGPPYPEVTVVWGVTNQGTGPTSSSWLDAVWLCSDTNLVFASLPLWEGGERGPLAPGQSYWRTNTIRTGIVQDGTWYLAFRTDDYYSLLEANETNNTAIVPITFHIQPPDLVPLSGLPNELTVPPNPDITLVWGITNQGTGAAIGYQPASVRFCTNSSRSSALDLANRSLQTPLPAQACCWWTNTVRLPVTQSGTYEFIIECSQCGTVLESITSNNVLVVPVTLQIVTPDLAALALQAPHSVTGSPNPMVNFVWGITNQGRYATTSPSWVDQLYLSTDQVLDAADIPITNSTQTVLIAAGGSYWCTNTARVPVVTSGSYYFILATDATSSLVEANEANNELAVPVTFTIQPSDLAPISLQVPGQVSAPPYPSVTLSYGVTNQGTGPAVGLDYWYDQMYLSTSPVLDATAQVAGPGEGWLERGPVGAGESYWRTVTVKLPAAQSGTYYLLFQANAAHNLFESDSANNVMAVPIVLDLRPPDLAPLALILPSQLVAGANPTATVAWGITNQGVGPATTAGFWADDLYFSIHGVQNDPLSYSLSSFEQECILPGGSYWRTNTFELPAVRSGTVFFLFTTDAWDQLSESDEYNNTLMASLTFELLPTLAEGQIQTDGSFKVLLYCDPGVAVTFQTSTDLVNWRDVSNFICTNSPMALTDAQPQSSSRGFYRVVTRGSQD